MSASVPGGQTEVRGIVVPVGEDAMLLPNAAVAEVLAYRDPVPYASAPRWLLGSVSWHDLSVPLVSLPDAAADAEAAVHPVTGPRARLVVCYTPNGNPELPYFAFLSVGPPRLSRFRADELEPDPDQPGNPLVLHALRFADSRACIPDLDAIERALLAVLQPGNG